MVPRADIIAIGEDQSVSALLQLLASAGIPAYRSIAQAWMILWGWSI